MNRHTFNCDRTCRTHELVDWCRFNPLLAELGAQVVNSHTTTVDVKIKSRTALDAAAKALGWQVLGEGLHTLYGSNTAQGYGVARGHGQRPIVLRADGRLAFDSMDAQYAKHLMSAYVLAATRERALNLGWFITAQDASSITVRHPTGGKVTVQSDGTVAASGFCGSDCHATAPIEAALGSVMSRKHTPEYWQQAPGNKITGKV